MNNSINTIRMLSIEMIEKANSGHPGICMGAAPMIYVLFKKIMKINPKNSNWTNRDRFILSAGHGSAMLYATLHLTGYDLKIDDLKQFRQLNSKTPGHPELGHTDGVDATSGPLGQGIAQSVGLAMAEKHKSSVLNRDGFNVVDNFTYAICGDGDLQEGVSAEASTLAGHFQLGKLIVLWDANEIQLDAPVKIACSENVLQRYESYNWQTLIVEDGNDLEEITNAINIAKLDPRPTLIKVKTIIGYGSPNESNKPDCHGAPLGRDEINLVKEFYGYTNDAFEVEQNVYDDLSRNSIENDEYDLMIKEYKKAYPELYEQFIGNINYNVEFDMVEKINEATRVSSGEMIQHINKSIPNLIGGSADLSKSNNSLIFDSKIFGVDGYEHKNISFGVREFAMASICNGMMIHGGLKVYCATFFVFSDYLKAALRMSAIQKLSTIYVLTHDSVAVGEDGPTHEPIEQIVGLRAIPNVNVIRPADVNETKQAWIEALNSKNTPTVLVLSRQNLNVVSTTPLVSKGAYVISSDENYDKVIIASGSEVSLCLEAKMELNKNGHKIRLISMPSTNIFDAQSQEYKDSLFGDVDYCDRYFVELSRATDGYKYAKNVKGIDTFGYSAPANDILNHIGFNVEGIVSFIENK